MIAPAVGAAIIVAGAWTLVDRLRGRHIEPRACGDCNVLLITIDTLRADRLHGFGGPSGLTPNLDRFAAEGLRLTRTYASAPLTLPSHASILTAVSPPVHGLRTNGLSRLGADRPTLATVLQARGYRTAAFVGSFVLDARFGLNRGFDVYDDRYGERHAGDPAEGAERRAEDVIRPALDWILRGTAAPDTQAGATSNQQPAPSNQQPATRWFAWIHLYDPHEPYRAPEPYASQHAPYDAEVAYVDAQVGRLMDALRTAGALDDTLVSVAADHGESLGEHGERTHGVFAYDVTMRVPWFLWAGARLHGAFDGMVRLVDLAPTLLDVLGVDRPRDFEGASVLPLLRAGRDGPPAYVEAMDANLTRNWAPLTGLVSGRMKLIDLPIPELYDLQSDPRESLNLHERSREQARALESLLRDRIASFGAAAKAAEPVTLSADSRQRLQALGYIGATSGSTRRTYADADDPKRLIGIAEDLNRALAAFRSGQAAPAMAAVRRIIEQHPGFSTANGVLASMQHDTGDLRGAISTLQQLVRRDEADQSVMVVLAGYLLEANAVAESAALLEAVVASHPDYADAYNTLGVAYSRMGRHSQARTAFNQVLTFDPTSATAYENLGVDAAAAGDIPGASDYLSRALALDPRLARAHNVMAAVLLRQGKHAEAVMHWRTALQLDPRLFDALYNLGTVLYADGRREEARPYLERFAAEAPRARYGPDIIRVQKMVDAR